MSDPDLIEPVEQIASDKAASGESSPAGPLPVPKGPARKIHFDRIAVLLGVIIILFFACRAAVLSFTHSAMKAAVRTAAGVPADVKDVKISLLEGEIRILGITLYNPPGFVERKLAYLPGIAVDINFWAFLKNRIHVKNVVIDIENVWVERNAKGQINLQVLTQAPKKKGAASAKEKKQTAAIQVDNARFSLDQIVYTESGRSPPFIRNYRVRMNSTLQNVSDPYNVTRQIAEAILERALKSAVTLQAGKMANQVSRNVKGFFQSRFTGR